jgi:cytidine deaminase
MIDSTTPIDASAWDALVAVARDVRLAAYAPYSRYRVGAALLLEDGRVVGGCNAENATYGATICAERGAICAAVAGGPVRVVAVVVVTEGDEPGAPCGICRQVLSEFGDDAVPVLMVAGARRKLATLGALLPQAFRGSHVTAGAGK